MFTVMKISEREIRLIETVRYYKWQNRNLKIVAEKLKLMIAEMELRESMRLGKRVKWNQELLDYKEE